jgi:MoaA/NifB/PqqE/SkfB family radical SAM enzyme
MCSAITYSSEEELNTQQVKDLYDQMKSLQLVRITGGEPFIRDDLPEIVHHIRKSVTPHLVHITTNGTLTDRIVDFVKENEGKKLFIAVSLDSLQDGHEDLRGEGAFNKTLHTLEKLKSFRSRKDFEVEINQTIVDDNLDEADKFAEYISHLGLKINYQLARNFHPSIPKPTEPDAPDCPIYPPLFKDLDKNKLDRLLQRILKERQDYESFTERLIRRYYITGVRNRLIRDEKYPNPRCVSLYDHVRLDPDGNILICRSDLTSAGNAAKHGFRNVWYGTRTGELRELVDHCKRCWYACESIPNGIYTWDVFVYQMKKIFKVNL